MGIIGKLEVSEWEMGDTSRRVKSTIRVDGPAMVLNSEGSSSSQATTAGL